MIQYIKGTLADMDEESVIIDHQGIGFQVYISGQTFEYQRRQRQAEGIAAAKAKGVKFGRPPRPLPDNFPEVYRAWRSKEMTLSQAAGACHMPVGTFYGKVRHLEGRTGQGKQKNL